MKLLGASYLLIVSTVLFQPSRILVVLADEEERPEITVCEDIAGLFLLEGPKVKGKRSCAWVVKRRRSRCKISEAKANCPVTCGICTPPNPTDVPSVAPTPTVSPTDVPTSAAPTTTVSPTPAYCEDLHAWYDSQGPEYNCEYYADRDNCLKYGYTHKHFGHSAITACCTCGGGITRNRSTVKVDVEITLPLSNLVPIEDEATRISILEALRRDFKHIVPHGSTVTGVEIAQSSSADHSRNNIIFQGSAGEEGAAAADPQDGSMTVHATQSVTCDDGGDNTCNEDQIGSGVEQEHKEEISKAHDNGSLPGAVASQFRLNNHQSPQVNGENPDVSSESQQISSFWTSLSNDTRTNINGVLGALEYGYALADIETESYRALQPYADNIGGTPIFKRNALVNYVERNIFSDTDEASYTISQTSMTEFAKELSNKLSIGGSYGSAFLGGTVKASASISMDASSQQEQQTYFTQFRLDYTFATSQIPLDPLGQLSESDIQELVDPVTLSTLQGLQDLDKSLHNQTSDIYVATMGIAFVRKVTFGGSFEMSSLVKLESWMTSKIVTDSVEASYTAEMGTASGSISASHSVNITNEESHSSSTFKTHFRGGDFTVYKDQEAWKQSVEKRPIIASYELLPIYELLSPNGKYWTSRAILKAAVNRAVTKFDGTVPNFSPPKPTFKYLPTRLSGSRYSKKKNCTTAIPPVGYALLGSGYLLTAITAAVKIDGVNAKLNTGWTKVWTDKGTGWKGQIDIWVPTIDDPDFVPCGYTSVEGRIEPSLNVAMLNKAVTNQISPYYGTLSTKPALNKIGWPEWNGQDPWQPNLFSNSQFSVYAPRWDVFKPS